MVKHIYPWSLLLFLPSSSPVGMLGFPVTPCSNAPLSLGFISSERGNTENKVFTAAFTSLIYNDYTARAESLIEVKKKKLMKVCFKVLGAVVTASCIPEHV